jgi:hypothetical protein
VPSPAHLVFQSALKVALPTSCRLARSIRPSLFGFDARLSRSGCDGSILTGPLGVCGTIR